MGANVTLCLSDAYVRSGRCARVTWRRREVCLMPGGARLESIGWGRAIPGDWLTQARVMQVLRQFHRTKSLGSVHLSWVVSILSFIRKPG